MPRLSSTIGTHACATSSTAALTPTGSVRFVIRRATATAIAHSTGSRTIASTACRTPPCDPSRAGPTVHIRTIENMKMTTAWSSPGWPRAR